MSWVAKRFWTQATAEACDGGHTVRLDGRAVRTPAKSPLVVPTPALARAIAAEWQAQDGRVRPETMPMTRMANSALDKVTPQFTAVVGIVAAYGGSDLLCYRAGSPPALVARQAAGWDPWLAWSATVLDAPLRATTGVIPVAQPQDSLDRLTARVADQAPHALVALHDLVAISGSLVLGLAVAAGRLTPAQAFDLSRIDEHWQVELWGRDDEAAAATAAKARAMDEAGRFLVLSRQADA